MAEPEQTRYHTYSECSLCGSLIASWEKHLYQHKIVEDLKASLTEIQTLVATLDLKIPHIRDALYKLNNDEFIDNREITGI